MKNTSVTAAAFDGRSLCETAPKTSAGMPDMPGTSCRLRRICACFVAASGALLALPAYGAEPAAPAPNGATPPAAQPAAPAAPAPNGAAATPAAFTAPPADAPTAADRIAATIESGAAFTGYNDIRIPGEGGTLLSFTDELSTDTSAYLRVQVAGRLGERHTIRALYAPLTLSAHGTVYRPIRFTDTIFPEGAELDGRFKFNSYRLTYRYSFWLDPKGEFALGATAKIRDASIRLEGEGLVGEKTNVGFVPLLHAMFRWRFAYPWSLLVEADALAAPQGRAEDVLAAIEYDLAGTARLHAGYRILEGGADNREVYTFTLVHYAAVGVTLHL